VGKSSNHLTIENDDAGGIESLITSAFAAADRFLADGAAIYICHPAGPLSLTFGAAFVGQGWELRQSLVWKKDAMVLGRSDYHYEHEPLLYGFKPGPGRHGRGSLGWYGGNDQTSVFEVPRPRASREHPTAKPVQLVAAMLRNSTRRGDIVLDTFTGSGSTMIACEQLGRRFVGLEIDPRYVDVAVARWERITGRVAQVETVPCLP
jgi:DNA modification methylase